MLFSQNSEVSLLMPCMVSSSVYRCRFALSAFALPEPGCLRLTDASTQLFSKRLDMVGPAAYMGARNEMQLYIFLVSRLAPPYVREALFTGPKQHELARIPGIAVIG